MRAQLTVARLGAAAAVGRFAQLRMRARSPPVRRAAGRARRRWPALSTGWGRWSPRIRCSRAKARPVSNSLARRTTRAAGTSTPLNGEGGSSSSAISSSSQAAILDHATSPRPPLTLQPSSPRLRWRFSFQLRSFPHGLSGRRGRRHRQCRARDPEHPRRARIPGRRDRGGGQRALDRRRHRFRRQRQGIEGPQHRAFRFRRLGHRPVRRRLGGVESLCADRRRGRLHGDRQ